MVVTSSCNNRSGSEVCSKRATSVWKVEGFQEIRSLELITSGNFHPACVVSSSACKAVGIELTVAFVSLPNLAHEELSGKIQEWSWVLEDGVAHSGTRGKHRAVPWKELSFPQTLSLRVRSELLVIFADRMVQASSVGPNCQWWHSDAAGD